MSEIPDDVIDRAARAWCSEAPIPSKGLAHKAARAALSAVGYGEMMNALKPFATAAERSEKSDAHYKIKRADDEEVGIVVLSSELKAARSALQKARGET